MTNIDLIECADKTRKISSKNLESDARQKATVKTWKILAAYSIDFYAILMLTGLMASLLDHGISTLMITNSLERAYGNVETKQIISFIFPLIVMSYFFFSYFFNQGQTWGMHVLKMRIQMSSMSFSTSFQWALYSISIFFTFGLSFKRGKELLEERSLGSFEVHDHLYNDLIRAKNWSPIVLVDELSNYHEAYERQETIHYDKSA